MGGTRIYGLTLCLLLFLPHSMSQLSPTCESDWNKYQASKYTTLWGAAMLDATGKRESGIIEGNYVFEGSYKLCEQVKENTTGPDGIQGLYCLASWPGPQGFYLNYRGFGYCIPRSCSDGDARSLLTEVLPVPFYLVVNMTQTRIYCVRGKDVSQDPAAIVSICILSIFAAVVIAATIYEFVSAKKKREHSSETSSAVTKSEDIIKGHINKSLEVCEVKDYSDLKLAVENGKIDLNDLTITNKGELDHTTVPSSCSDSHQNEVKRYVAPPNSKQGSPEKTNTVKHNFDLTEDTQPEKPNIMTRLLLSFSLCTNAPRLISMTAPTGTIRCLPGIRFLAMSWIILGHTYTLGWYDYKVPVTNRWTAILDQETYAHKAIQEMWLSVETFFIMGAMLVTISFLKTVERQGGHVTCRQMALYYFHRYWRLTPVYAVVLMIMANLFIYFGDGPFYPENYFNFCQRSWWSNLLYINNLSLEWNWCMGWTWYLACDFQFYVMAPLFLILTCYFAPLGLVAMIAGYCGSLIANIVLYHQYYTGNLDEGYYLGIYVKPWTRSSVYFIGMLLGYIVYKTRNREIKIPKVIVWPAWFVSLSLIYTSVYVKYYNGCSGDCDPWDLAGYVAYSSLQTTMFDLGVAWIIFACIKGYGGFINSILSWKIWLPLSRLTYTGYLIHPLFMFLFAYTVPVQIYLYDWLLIYLFLGHLVLTLGASFVMTLVFEIPMLGLEKVLIASKK